MLWLIPNWRSIAACCFIPALGGCGKILLQMTGGGNPNVITGLAAAASGDGLFDRCGISLAQLSDSSAVIVDQSLRGLIVAEGISSGDIHYKITLEANAHARVTSSFGYTDTLLSVKEVIGDDDGRFTKDYATDAARKGSNRVTTIPMSSGLLLNLQNSDPAFAKMECSVGFVAQSKTETVEGIGIIDVTPGYPSGVNPKASIQTLATELGDSRSFTSTFKVTSAGKDWSPVGTTGTMTVTIKKVSPDIHTVAGMPANATQVTADTAYEVTTTTSTGVPSLIGLPRRQVYFINTQTKSVEAAFVDYGKFDAQLKKEVPPVFVVRVSS